MIVVDSSALCAVFFNEPEKSAFQDILDGEERCVISAVNAHETACVLRGEPRRIDDAIRSVRVIVEGYRPAPGKILTCRLRHVGRNAHSDCPIVAKVDHVECRRRF